MPKHNSGNTAPENTEPTGLLPKPIVFIVQIMSSFWKALALSLIGLPMQIIVWIFTIVDIAWSNFFRIVLGTWCKPCAWVVVFFFKVATFPLLLLGWSMRILLGVTGFVIDGWMLAFGGSGCFLRWGYDCSVKKLSEREYWEIGTLPFWIRDPSTLLPSIPQGSWIDSVKNHFVID
jgi:hypothetical protein